MQTVQAHTTVEIVERFIESAEGSFTPSEVAKKTGQNAVSVRGHIRKLADRGDLIQEGYGRYRRAEGGDGAAVPAGDAAEQTPSPPAFATPAQLRRLGLVRIPPLTVEAGAGLAVEVSIEAIDEDGAGLIISEQQARREFGMPPDRLHTIRARGDSMAPTILPGDEVVVGRVEAGTLLVDGAVYSIAGPDGILIKRLRFSVDYDEHTPRRWVHIVSDNAAVPSYRVPAEVFERDYRVVAAFLRVNRPL